MGAEAEKNEELYIVCAGWAIQRSLVDLKLSELGPTRCLKAIDQVTFIIIHCPANPGFDQLQRSPHWKSHSLLQH
nr:hypothetical protein CFP56_22307 [Quercus suber]